MSPEGLSRAAVLVPLVFRGPEPELLFTRRTETVETHKGQISFPGGVMHENDSGTVATALRETEEEIGVPSALIEPLGLLDDLHTPTGFIITPVVGLVANLPGVHPNPAEVAEIFFVPLEFFLDPVSGRSEERRVGEKLWEVWYYDYGGRTIWGATAAIIRSLVREMEGDTSREKGQ
jgi:8-oxo-dGTP pyrophosphatase MutT (NUDIX family)